MSIEVKYKEPAERPIDRVVLRNGNRANVFVVSSAGPTEVYVATYGSGVHLRYEDLRALARALDTMAKELES